MVEHLTALLERATTVPAVNQLEVHPYFAQPEVRAFGAEPGRRGGPEPEAITLEAFGMPIPDA
jgi:hypothetical protein